MGVRDTLGKFKLRLSGFIGRRNSPRSSVAVESVSEVTSPPRSSVAENSASEQTNAKTYDTNLAREDYFKALSKIAKSGNKIEFSYRDEITKTEVADLKKYLHSPHAAKPTLSNNAITKEVARPDSAIFNIPPSQDPAPLPPDDNGAKWKKHRPVNLSTEENRRLLAQIAAAEANQKADETKARPLERDPLTENVAPPPIPERNRDRETRSGRAG